MLVDSVTDAFGDATTPATFDNGTSGSSSSSSSSSSMSPVVSYIYIVCVPILLLLGSVGNTVGFLIVPRQCCPSVAIHFRVLAVSAIMASFSYLVPTWVMRVFSTNLKSTVDVICKILVFVNYMSGDMAIWIVVFISLDRLLAIAAPLRAKKWCSPRSTIILTLIVGACVLIKNAHVLYTRGVERGKCRYVQGPLYYWEITVHPWVTLVLAAFLPVTLICIFNLGVAYLLVKFRKKWERRRSAQFAANVDENGNRSNVGSATFSKYRRRETQAIRLSITISVLYIVTIFPIFIIDLLDMSMNLDDVKAIANLLLYCNYCLHFFAYCGTCTEFRRQFFTTLLCRKESHNSSSDSGSTTVSID